MEKIKQFLSECEVVCFVVGFMGTKIVDTEFEPTDCYVCETDGSITINDKYTILSGFEIVDAQDDCIQINCGHIEYLLMKG